MLCCEKQCTKKVVSDIPGLVKFVVRLVDFVLCLPDGQVKFFEDNQMKINCKNTV